MNVIDRIFQIRQALRNVYLKKKLLSKEFGVPKSHVEALYLFNEKETFKDIPVDPAEQYYVYTGPAAERDFCVYMLKIDKVFSRTDIDTLSTLMGYDVFEYQPGPVMKKGGPGGPNCKHKWRRFRGKFIISGNVPTDRQINSLISKSIFE